MATVTTTPLPPYISSSPCGFHTADLAAFSESHRRPLSTDPGRLAFASPDVVDLLTSQVPPDAAGFAMAKLMIYNKVHTHDRICPSCRRCYRVGEPARPWLGTFEAWLARPYDRTNSGGGGGGEYVEEQELSEICSRMCFELLTEVEAEGWSEAAVNEWANRDVKALVGMPADVAVSGRRVRKTTVEEQAVGGVKIVWERRGGGGGGG